MAEHRIFGVEVLHEVVLDSVQMVPEQDAVLGGDVELDLGGDRVGIFSMFIWRV